MERLIKQYEDYYLIKCYGQEKYQSDFNKGILYLKSLSYFHNVENSFQQDKEGMIFQQAEKSVGTFYKVGPNERAIVSDLMKKGNVAEGVKVLKEKCHQTAETKDLYMNVNGFLCCFYLIPKKCLSISKNNIDILPLREYANFFYFLNSYAEQQGYTYFSIYDASILISKICQALDQENYDFTFGSVTYRDVGDQTKIKWFLNNQIAKIVFTKPTRLEYQREFRFFVSPKNQTTGDSISITADSLESTVVSSLAYLTPKYCKGRKEG